MLLASSTDLAITLAVKRGTVRIIERQSRYGLGAYFAIEDEKGLIEVHASRAEAEARVR
jgi:hypothetical protein